MYDILIIGSGPAGLSAAIYGKRALMSLAVIEKDFMGTGQIAVTERVENYPGLYGINGYDLGEKFRNHAETLGAEFLNAEVKEIRKDENSWTVNFTDGNSASAKAIIYAAGASYRHLGVPGDGKQRISYCAVCDGFFYKDKKVAVVGGGSSSLTEALYLSKICKEVIIIHRRDKLTSDKYLIDKVNSTKNIKVLYNSNITKYNQNNNKLTSVTINNKDILEVEGVFLAIGSTPNSEIFNVNKENNYIIVDSNYMTNIDKVYAIGDVIKKDYYQLSTASSDAVVAASNIIKRENNNS